MDMPGSSIWISLPSISGKESVNWFPKATSTRAIRSRYQQNFSLLLKNLLKQTDTYFNESLARQLFANGRSIREQFRFAGIVCQSGSPLKFKCRFRMSAELFKEVPAYTGQQVIVRQSTLQLPLIDKFKAGCRPKDHGDCHSLIEFHHRGRHDRRELGV